VPRLIVLRNGKVFEGVIHLARDGYEVESGGGRIYLAEPYIWFTAESRQDAYRVMRERIPEATADGHVRIAQWCVENGLHSAAREELKSALRLEPQHNDARSMLRLLEPSRGTTTGSASARPAEPLPGDIAPLGGLSAEIAREFVTRVQPILVNRCGNAACHGTVSRSAFRLKAVRSGQTAHRAHTAANLESVWKQISLDDPAASPLLVAPSHPGHGGTRKPLFIGAAGEAQLRSLTSWVQEVARSSATNEASEPSPGVRLTSAPAADAYRDGLDGGVDSAALPPSAEADETSAVLERIVAEERPDAFDPDEFNRRFGPRADQTSKDPIQGPSR
jgi:hypothetical protein